MKWSDKAEAEGQAILANYAEDLWEESSRIAARAKAGAVSEDYVKAAALHLRLSQPGQGGADVALGGGGILFGLAGGVGAAMVTGATQVEPWVAWGSLGAAILGAVIFAVGAAVKVIRR